MTRRVGLLLILGFAGILVASTFHLVDYYPGADEGFYLRYSSRIAAEGPGVFPQLFQEYLNSEKTNQYFPSPMRVGTLLISGAAVRLGGASYRTLSLLSLAAFLALLLVILINSRRCFGERTAFWITLFLAGSPFHMALARRALSDTLGSLLINGSLWALWWALSDDSERKGRRWWFVSALYAVTFLAKGSTFILIPISLFFLCRQSGWFRRPFPWWPTAAVSVVPLAILPVVLVTAAGGFDVLWRTAQFARGAYSSPYALQYLQGPWFRYVVDFLLISPWTTLMYLIWLGVLLASPTRDEGAWFWGIIPPLYLAGAAFFPLRDARYLLALEMPVRMGALFLIQRLVGEQRQNRWAAVRMGMVLLPLLWIDLRTFYLFVITNLYEPTSFYLLHLRHFLPR